MANTKISIDALSETVMKELNEYADLACDDMKEAVKSSSTLVKNQIKATAPKSTGAYAKSWSTKNTRETSRSLEMTVYSRNRYQLAHLLEHGHAKRGSGRVPGRSHIAPAELSPSRKNGQEKCEKSRMKQTGANESKVKRQKLHTAAFQNRRAISIQSKSEDELCCRKLQYKQRYRSVPPAWSGSGADEPAHISDS